jgi:pimeloyl-ACP methyl ester carboxylesterase
MRSCPLLALVVILAPSCATQRSSAPASPGAERVTLVPGTAGKLRVSDGGIGEPAVVFVHGLGGDLETWRAQLDHVRSSRRAVAYDQRGHGASDRPRDGVYTIDALAQDLDVLTRLLGLRRFVLVGHSMAGTVLTAYAGGHPEAVAGLVYVDAVGDFEAIPREKLLPTIAEETSPLFGAAQVRAAFEEMLGPRARPATRERVLASVQRLDPPAFGLLRRSMFEFRAKERYEPYRGPATAVEPADADPPVLASKVLGLPRTAVPGVSHWVMLDDPAAVNAALDAFLAGLPGAPDR